MAGKTDVTIAINTNINKSLWKKTNLVIAFVVFACTFLFAPLLVFSRIWDKQIDLFSFRDGILKQDLSLSEQAL